MKTMVILMATLFLLAGNVVLPGDTISGTITAEAASSSVKALAVGQSYTISGYAKVTSSKASVAKATKKSSSKYTVKALKKGTVTLKCCDSAGNLKKSIYLIATNSSTISYDTSSVTLVAGKTKTVKASAQSGCTVKYSSSKKSVATVSGSGKITAKKAGTATITASVYYKGKKVKSAAKTVKVVNYKYSTTAVTLTKGSSKTVKATVASGYKVKYSSSNSSVASVSSSGKITAKKAGTATISAKIYKGSTLKKTYKKNVTVKAAATTIASTAAGNTNSSSAVPELSISYDASEATISPGKTVSAKVTVTNGYTVTYSSSDTSVATVNDNGLVTSVGNGGSAYICGKIYYGSVLKKTVFKKITVRYYYVSGYALNPYVGKEQTIKCGYKSDGTCDADDVFVWESSDASIVSITPSGNSCTIKAESVGTATVTCKVNGIICMTFKQTPQYTEAQKLRMVQPSDYNYEVYLVGVDKIFSDSTVCIYIKTDNPDYSTVGLGLEYGCGFILSYQMDDIEYTTYRTPVSVSGSYCSTTDYMVMSSGFSTVPGGYLATIRFSSGENTLYVLEVDSDGKPKCVQKIDVKVIKSSEAESEWIQWLINNCTTSGMTSFEKMSAICAYLRNESGFTYLHNKDDLLLCLSTDRSSCFYRKTWDSYESPYVLTYIAEAIGGFDYIHCCYGDYEYGTSSWIAMHHFAAVGIGDDIRYYSVCPSSSTGVVSTIDYIDFSSMEDLTKIDEIDVSLNWSDYYPEPSTSSVSAASVEETASMAAVISETGETEMEEMEISLFTDDETGTSSADTGFETDVVQGDDDIDMETSSEPDITGADMADEGEDGADVILDIENSDEDTLNSIEQIVEAPDEEDAETEVSMEIVW